jgi:DNA polymerase elongation subunit (family B)
MRSQGWLFDVYPAQTTMVVWLYQEDGALLRLEDPFRPRLYARGRSDDLQALARATLRTRVCSRCTLTRQREFWSRELVTVLALEVADYRMFPRLLRRLPEFESRITFYNCDLPLPQYYLYCRKLFPFGQCEVEHDGRTIARIRGRESSTEQHYVIPSLRLLELQLTQDPLIPLQRGNTLQITLDGQRYECTTNDPAELLDQLNAFLTRYDPDLILTDYGDTAIFPALLRLARRHRMPLALDREPAPIERRLVTEGQSFFTYGKMLYFPPAYPLYGRWHIDRAHSFLYHETGFAGIIELARLAKLPVQRAARASIGTILTSMQLDVAVQRRLLIPWRKGEPERWKTADVLLKVDKGGLVFQPPVGAFDNVAELDFSAMYPTIMVQHNISAETLFCRCCDNHVVPEAGYTICERHEGLMAAMLRPLIKRRAYYKTRLKEGGITPETAALYDQRQRAHKWIGVTCLDGNTTVLYCRHGRWQISPIRDVVEGYLPASQWGQQAVDDLAVLGVDVHLQHGPKRVQSVLKVPAPATMLRIKLRWGREILLTPDHPCYILQHGRLEVRRADALAPGTWVPIGVSLAGACEGTMTVVHLVRILKNVFSAQEQELWRVFGSPIRRWVRERYGVLAAQARNAYAAKTIWNWREYGYVPLCFFDPDHLTLAELGTLSMGRGKREGGIIQRIPSRVHVDEELGFLLGFFVGDGSATRNMLRFDVGLNEREHLRRLRAILRRKFRVRARCYRERRAKMYVLQVNSIALVEVFERAFGIKGSADRRKLHVPEVILNGPAAARRGFILGLIASDGHISRRRNFAGISSAARGLIAELGWLFALLGVDYRFAHDSRMHQIQTRNLGEARKLLYDGAPISRKHLRILQRRRWVRHPPTLAQLPVVDSGLWDLCKAARVVRVPRISGVEMIAKTMANYKLRQVSQRIHRLDERLVQQLERVYELVQSSLTFAQVLAIEQVRATNPFVYCFQLAEEPEAFFIEGGVLTHNCFGYLGYRNARFGRIESHEAVTAFGREKLLQAKEICEAHGYELLHALTDSVWIRQPGLTEEELLALCDEITAATDVTMSLEGRYRWIVFLPSKVRPHVAVANRYFGVFWDGTLKARGLAYRRHDVPVFIQATQWAMLDVLAEAENLADCVARIPKALEVLRDIWEQLATGHIPPLQLLVAKTVSQELEAYRVENATAQALRQLRAVGIHLHPGERVRYLIRDTRAPNKEERVRAFPRLGPDDGFDVAQYQAMLLDAALELLVPFGYDEARLRQAMA